MGLPRYDVVEIDEGEYRVAYAEAKRQHPEESVEEVAARTIARIVYRKEKPKAPAKQEPVPTVIDFGPQLEAAKRWLYRRMVAGFVLLAILFVLSTAAHCQLTGLQIQDSNGAAVKSWFAGIVKIKCGTNLTCVLSNGVVTVSATGSGGVNWGSIGGTLSSQTDLNTALGGKVGTGVTVNGHALSANVTVTATDVGLGNVDNTSD